MGQDQELSALFDTDRALNPSRAVIASTFMWLPLFIAILGHAMGMVPGTVVGRETEWVILVAVIAGWSLTTYQITHHNSLDWHAFRIPALVAAVSAMIVANGGIAIVQNDIRHFAIAGGCLVAAGGLSFSVADYFFPMHNQKHNLARALALTLALFHVFAAAGTVATFFDGFSGIAFGLYAAIIMLLLGLLWVAMYRIVRLFFVLIMATILANAALIWLYLLGGWSLLRA
jgi:hypothetical protein